MEFSTAAPSEHNTFTTDETLEHALLDQQLSKNTGSPNIMLQMCHTSAYNAKSTEYNVTSTAYNVKTTGHNDKTTAYNAKTPV